jgi:hypothetical protein
MIDLATENLINLYLNIYTTLNVCNRNKISLDECCRILQGQYEQISCEPKKKNLFLVGL